jgi:hypothetical protein
MPFKRGNKNVTAKQKTLGNNKKHSDERKKKNRQTYRLEIHERVAAEIGGESNCFGDPQTPQGNVRTDSLVHSPIAAQDLVNGTRPRSITPNHTNMAPKKRPRIEEQPGEKQLRTKEKQNHGFLTCTEEAVRMYCFVAFVQRYNMPDESEWGSISKILAKEVSVCVRTVTAVFERERSGHKESWKQAQGKGRHRKLQADNNGLLAGALALNTGVSPEMATTICNETNNDNPKVCRKTFLETLSDYTDLDSKATPRRKTGSKDVTSAWAVARKVIAEQMTEQFRLGDEVDKGNLKSADCLFVPLHDDAILFADENHVQQTIGGSGHTSTFSSRQYFVAMDPSNGRLKRKKEGGKVPARRYRVVPKYPKESRGCYGVAAPFIDGKRRGVFIKPFDYTLKELVSYKVWKQSVANEIKKRKKTKGKSSPWYKFKDADNPYLARYGLGWEAKMEVEAGSELKPIRSCHQMIDHLIKEGEKIWNGTKREHTWMIYHDHLKIFWEKETIEYLKSLKCPIPRDDSTTNRTWFERLIKIEGANNVRVNARYNNTLPGDGPELMPLDNHLFADLREALARNIALTFWMPKSDARKYTGGTPHELYKSICRTIESNGVSEHRIIEDIR